MHFYLQEYEFAIRDFERAFEIKKVNVKYYKNREKLENSEEEKNEVTERSENDFVETAELYEFFNTSFNVYEHYHNLIICHMISKQFIKALEILNNLEQIIPEPFKANLEILKKIIEMEMGINARLKNSGKKYILKSKYFFTFFKLLCFLIVNCMTF